ncbi:PIN domain-containing protein [Gracilinema caldarium]|uniref:PIN domain-containing protein n=1 Tax=Gracilinema caldarium TaxID=215591 RepID=UPI0026EFCA0C|nr:PIN domain-containing protein [Gracilinema caldarium]
MILVDSSVWIEYFKGNDKTLVLNTLIDHNTICVNDLILAELLPSINQRKEIELKELLLTITKIPLNINWNTIIYMQTQNLKNGINKVGIADLVIAQNVIDNNLELYSLDHHFELMSELHGFRLFYS